MATGRCSKNADIDNGVWPLDLAVDLPNLDTVQILESIRQAVFVAEANTGRIVVWNPAAERIFGYSSSEVLGHRWTVLVPEHLKAQCEASMARYRDTGHGPYIDSHAVLELPAVRKGGEEITIEITLSPIEPTRDLEGDTGRFVLAIVRDVTERKEVERVLKESERRFRSLVQNTSDIITVLDADGTVRYISPAVERVTGHKPEEQVGTDAFSSVHPDDRERALGIFAETLKTPGLHPPLEFRVPHRDGSWRYLEHVVNNLLDDPSVKGIVINSRDITERKRAEAEIRRFNEYLEKRVAERTVQLESALAELEESEKLYRTVVKQAAESIFLVDAESTRILETNAAFYKSLGYTEEELLRMTLYDVIAHDRESVDDNVRRILKKGHHFIGERRYRRKDGSLADVEVSARAISYNGREALCVVAHDITERKRTEKALKESERRFRQFFENSADALFVHDERGRFVDCNAEACRALGYAREELLELSVADVATHLISEEERREKKGETLWERAMQGEPGRIVGFEENELRRRDGTTFPVEVGVGAIEYEGQRLILASARETTERKRAEEELRQLNEDLEQRVRRRTAQLVAFNSELEAFSYSVSHDLRAPLRAIDGFSQILLEDYEDRLDEQGRLYLKRTKDASQRMGHLIDDLLDLSRMTRSEMHRERVDLSTLARAVAEEFRRTQPEHQVEVVVEEGLVAEGDGRLLRVALENLLGNAWKFTRHQPHPKIEVGILKHEDTPAYFVRDNGVGFDIAYADKLFGAFQRLHSEREFEGTGIGLATVQRIIHRHGGQVWAKSEVGKGATFFFNLWRSVPRL
jgi:PAS domain S-box-containing protein